MAASGRSLLTSPATDSGALEVVFFLKRVGPCYLASQFSPFLPVVPIREVASRVASKVPRVGAARVAKAVPKASP